MNRLKSLLQADSSISCALTPHIDNTAAQAQTTRPREDTVLIWDGGNRPHLKRAWDGRPLHCNNCLFWGFWESRLSLHASMASAYILSHQPSPVLTFSILFIFYFFVHVCVGGWGVWAMGAGTCSGQGWKILQDLELQAVMNCLTWVLGSELRFSARALGHLSNPAFKDYKENIKHYF